MALVTRLGKGFPLTTQEMDDNLTYLESSISVGTSGTSGSSGSSGAAGSSGSSGTSGISGSVGSSGSAGSSGTSGSSGSSGVDGVFGLDGTSGSSGADGSSGSSGTSGSSGSSGSSGTSGTSGSGVSLSMSDGSTFADNITFIVVNSPLALTDNGAGGATISVTSSLDGTSGVDGSSGTSGTSGVDGLSGTSGTSGVSGVDGTSGIDGTDGTAGTSGTSGVSGFDGLPGTSGTSGTSGNSISLTLRQGVTVVPSVEDITLEGNVTLEDSGSNGAKLIVNDLPANTVSSSAQISEYEVFAELNSVNEFTDGNIFAGAVNVSQLESTSSISLTTQTGVIIASSVFRLASFTNAETGSLVAQNGDMIYNSTIDKFVGYAGGEWIPLH